MSRYAPATKVQIKYQMHCQWSLLNNVQKSSKYTGWYIWCSDSWVGLTLLWDVTPSCPASPAEAEPGSPNQSQLNQLFNQMDHPVMFQYSLSDNCPKKYKCNVPVEFVKPCFCLCSGESYRAALCGWRPRRRNARRSCRRRWRGRWRHRRRRWTAKEVSSEVSPIKYAVR